MDDTGQGRSGGFSKSEKAMLARAACVGAIASVVTLWMGNVFTSDALARPGMIEIVLACISSFFAGTAVSIMGETVIEDLVKLPLFGFLWWFTRSYELLDLFALGALTGGGVAFVSNRFKDKPRRERPQRKKRRAKR